MRCRGIPSHVARCLFTVHDRAISEDHGDAIACFTRFFRGVVIQTHRAVILVFFAPAKLLGQRFFDIRAGSERIDQFVVQSIFCRIAIHFLQPIQHRLRAREDLLRGDLTVSGNGGQIVIPQFANPAAVGFTRGRGHIIANKRFNGGFVGPDAEDMCGHFQLLEQRFVIQAVRRKAVQINRTLWGEPNFVGKARQIILPLAVAIAHRNHRFTAVAEFAQGFTDILH
ncbi:hypothetical protein D3C78_726190 [compost metagenome]